MRPTDTASPPVSPPVTILRTTGEASIRNRDYGEAQYVIPGLLYYGVTVIYADGGLGKTVLAHGLEHHLAYGRPFGGWVTDERRRCLVVSLEDDERQVSERSFRLAPSGALDTDGHPEVTEAEDWHDMIEHAFYVAGDTFERRLDNLRLHILAEAEAGRPFGYVRIDTYGDFIGGKPKDSNAYEWDKFCSTRLNKLALENNLALVLIHHTNKSGDFSGSEGLRGGVTTLAVLERSTENPETEAVLRSRKCRVAPEFSYALVKSSDGIWDFTDEIAPTEAQLQGMSRAAYSVLVNSGPMTRQEISKRFTDVNQNSLQVCLSRLKRKGLLIYVQGQWRLAEQQLGEGLLPRRCKNPSCSVPLMEDLYGDGYHATCSPSPAPPPPAEPQLSGIAAAVMELPLPEPRAAADDDQEQLQAEEEFFGDATTRQAARGAYKAMRASLEASRMKPLACVPKEIRSEAPWTLMDEWMDGGHRWLATELPQDGWVRALDRTGSFPSACSSVPVAANRLHHITSGDALADRRKFAGIWQIEIPEWDEEKHKIGHPLGRLAEREGLVWVTSSHMEQLDKLVLKKAIAPVVVAEAWIGRRSTSLFERFCEWARKTYAMPESEERTKAKTGASQAMRALWTKKEETRSPWHRPDWNLGIRSEASVRHWVRAKQAVDAGARLLSLGLTDEAVFWTPTEPTPSWVPAPYVPGTKFGEVKFKFTKPIEDWKDEHRGARKR